MENHMEKWKVRWKLGLCEGYREPCPLNYVGNNDCGSAVANKPTILKLNGITILICKLWACQYTSYNLNFLKGVAWTIIGYRAYKG